MRQVAIIILITETLIFILGTMFLMLPRDVGRSILGLDKYKVISVE